jgi:ABC-2 type transport system permease protein
VSDASLALRQVAFTNKAFWRNPASAFFTFAFPLMFLVIFTALLGSGTVDFTTPFGVYHLDQATYFVVAMASFGVITACYTNVAIGVVFQRDAGILKRTRGTPLPGWAYLAGRVLHAMIIAVILVAITATFGALFYSAHIPSGIHLLEFLAILLVGGVSFCALGLAATTITPNADAAPPVVNATILPLYFISGVFIPVGSDAPGWLKIVAGIFPVRHFVDAMRAGYLGSTTIQGTSIRVFPFHWIDVLIVLAWGLGGLIVAARFFTWEPHR